ncbi:phytoene desaturase family protein [Sutcliffiella halmapala]|uniref:phytoene desaturase family protein n=1 Tax=Sutcliffiella halmapala TaxID=79882 RepID=UPI000994CE6B|nr:FAD-dependent oxidoreductase [Sutcliffiella halmapala]
MNKYEVAIIGGGIAGLTAAIFLAQEGKKVLVLEKAPRYGGRGMTINKNGILMNLGAHALYKGGEAKKILDELKIPIYGKEPSKDGHVIWKDDVYQIPMDFSSLFSKQFLSVTEKFHLAKLMNQLSKMNVRLVQNESLQAWAEREIKRPIVRHFFYAFCRTTTITFLPHLQLARPVLMQVQRALTEGVLYIDNGWESIVTEFKKGAIQLGVELREARKVTHIDGNEKVERVVCATGESFEVENVIIATPPQEACRLVPQLQKTSLFRWQREALAVTSSCLDIGLRRLPNPKHQFVLGLDQPIFFTNQSRAAKLSDDGSSVVSLVKYHDENRNTSDVQQDKKQLEQMMDVIQPGWREEVVEQQYLPHITVVHNFPHVKRTEVPGTEIPEMKGLYIAGDWVCEEELLVDAAAVSAKRAALQILKKDRVLI